MGWSNDQFTGTLVIPTGATSGARIVLDGTTGTILVYDSTGDLLASLAPMAGTDGVNAYLEGFTVGTPGESQMRLTTRPSGAGVLFMPTNLAAETREASVVTEAVNEGTANEYIATQLQGAERNNAGFMVVDLNSGIPTGTGLPTFRVIHSNGSVVAVVQVDEQRMQLAPPTASANPVLYVNAPSGHTGDLLRLALNGTTKASVDVAGDLTANNIQVGTETFTFSAVTFVDVTVTFPHAFTSTPRVTATLRGLPAGSSALQIRANNVTTTGCVLRVADVGAVARTLTINADWIAIDT